MIISGFTAIESFKQIQISALEYFTFLSMLIGKTRGFSDLMQCQK